MNEGRTESGASALGAAATGVIIGEGAGGAIVFGADEMALPVEAGSALENGSRFIGRVDLDGGAAVDDVGKTIAGESGANEPG